MKRIKNKLASLLVVSALAVTAVAGAINLPLKALAETRTVTESDLTYLFKVTDGENAIDKAVVKFAEAEIRTSKIPKTEAGGSWEGACKANGVYIDRVATAGNDANGEIMQINYEKPIYLADNELTTPFIKFAVPNDGNETWTALNFSGTTKSYNVRSYDVIDVTVEDAENANNYFVVTIYPHNNYGESQPTGSFISVRTAGRTVGFNTPSYTNSPYKYIVNTSVCTDFRNKEYAFYYDYESNSLKVGNYNDTANDTFVLSDITAIKTAKLTIRTIKNLKNASSYRDVYGKNTTLQNFNAITNAALKNDKSAKLVITNIDGVSLATSDGTKNVSLVKESGAGVYGARTNSSYLDGATKQDPQPEGVDSHYTVYDNFPLVINHKDASLSYDTANDKGLWAAADSVVAAGKNISVAPLSAHNIFSGVTENKAISENYYVKAFNGDKEVTIDGLNSGKWTENATITTEKTNATYTVKYYADETCSAEVAEYDVYAIKLELRTLNKASIKASGKQGLRFQTVTLKEDKQAIETMIADEVVFGDLGKLLSVEYGTRITSANKKGHLDITTKMWNTDSWTDGKNEYGEILDTDDGVFAMYSAVLTGFSDTYDYFNYDFTAQAYAVLTFENGNLKIESDSTATRSIAQIANLAINDCKDVAEGEYTVEYNGKFYKNSYNVGQLEYIAGIAAKYNQGGINS